MKIARVFGIVLAIHIVMALLFVQGGCQSRQAPPPPPGGETGLRPVDWDSPDPAAEWAEARPRSTPTRPTTPPPPVAPPAPVTDPWEVEPLRPLPSERLDLPPAEPATVYTVRRGDSLWLIAQRHGISVQALTEFNGLSPNAVIHPGQDLLIPPGASRPSAVPTAPATPAARPEGTVPYTVQRGDSLSVIAARHGTTVRNLQTMNQLSGDVIQVGQTLYVPERSGRASDPAAARTPLPAAVDSGGRHVVRSGETPGGIAARYGVTVDELMKANNISDPRRLQIGQELIIPGRQEATAPRPSPQPREPAPQRPAPEPPPSDLRPVDILQDLDDLPVIEIEPEPSGA